MKKWIVLTAVALTAAVAPRDANAGCPPGTSACSGRTTARRLGFIRAGAVSAIRKLRRTVEGNVIRPQRAVARVSQLVLTR